MKPVRIAIEYEDGTIDLCTALAAIKDLEYVMRVYCGNGAYWPFEQLQRQITRVDNPKQADSDRKAFAMAAMQGLCANPCEVTANDFIKDPTEKWNKTKRDVAAIAVEFADALLLELQRSNEKEGK
jgi:hypothetical protein